MERINNNKTNIFAIKYSNMNRNIKQSKANHKKMLAFSSYYRKRLLCVKKKKRENFVIQQF